jgi:hypothetical protein
VKLRIGELNPEFNMWHKGLSAAERAENLADQRLKCDPLKGGARRPAMAGHDGRWYVVKVDARRLEIADHLAALGFEVLSMFDGYMIIRSLDMGSDACSVEKTSGVAAILRKTGLFEYARDFRRGSFQARRFVEGAARADRGSSVGKAAPKS